MNKIALFLSSILFLFVIALMAFVVKGDVGSPIAFQDTYEVKRNTPFEASNTTSRYTLTRVIVENHDFFFNLEQAKFASPDVVRYNGRFFSIFMPGVSFLAVPFYMWGAQYGMPQLFAFLTTIVFALINFGLIVRISIKMGVSLGAALMGALVFIFGTNALAYATNLTQHHYTTTIILLMLLLSFGRQRVMKNIAIGALYGGSILIDVPNLIVALPIILYMLWKHIDISNINQRVKIAVRPIALWMLVGFIPMIGLVAVYNHAVSGSYTTFPQNIRWYTGSFEEETIQKEEEAKKIGETPQATPRALTETPFRTRAILRGFGVLLTGDERSWLFYSPVLFIGFLSLFFKSKLDQDRRNILYAMLALILMNILLYSMFSDPWGGWSFGARYLIPAAALTCVLLGIVLEVKKKSVWMMILFTFLLFYSIRINVLGAITTTNVPTKGAAQTLPDPLPYIYEHTYNYNIQFIDRNVTSSLIYNLYLKDYITVREFWNYLATAAFILVMIPYVIFISINLALSRKQK